MAFLNTLSTSYLSVSRSSLGTGAALDEFGQNALFGYSLRKVRDDADKCIRVVRGNGDNVEQDIGFTSDGIVDIEAITTFAQGFPCYVKLWYDQAASGGTFHLGSTVEAQQPLIAGNSDHIWQDMKDQWYYSYDTYGYVYIDPSNGLPYIYFGEGRYFQFVETGGNYADSSGWSTGLTNLTDDYSVFFLGQSDRFGGAANILVGNGGSDRVNLSDDTSVYSVNGTGATISLSDGLNEPYVWEIERNGSNNLSLYRNNTNLITSTTTAAGEFTIDKVGEFFNGDVFEILGYSATQVERDDLYDNIDEHYGIESYTSLAALYADIFLSRVEIDGGAMESPYCLAKDLSPMLNDDEPQSSAFDADYQAVLDRSTALGYTAPSAAQQTLQNTLVTDLKSAGIWSKLDVFYVFATDGDSDYATLNWKAPSNFQLTKTNSPTFTQNEGFAQSGTAYLETGFILDTNGTNYTQDNAGFFVGFPTLSSTAGTNNRPIGVEAISNYLNIRIDADGTNANNRVWLNTGSSYGNLNYYKKDDSIYFANRTSSTAVDYRNTDLANDLTNSFSGSTTSSSLPNKQLLLLGWSGGYFEQTANMGVFALGSSLTAAEMADIEEAWYTNYFS